MTGYRICNNCIMDTSDPGIAFDARGVCDYCNNFEATIKPHWDTAERGRLALHEMADAIRAVGNGHEFDCIIGLSGGLDSSYAAYIAKEVMGLRPLLFHVDAGWNTDQAVGNIEKLVDGLGLDLYTDVVNWESVKRMQVAFLRAGIPDQDLVQDAAFFSGLYKFARRHKIRHIITGPTSLRSVAVSLRNGEDTWASTRDCLTISGRSAVMASLTIFHWSIF